MSQSWNIAVSDADTGEGQALVELLMERKFPLAKLFLLSQGNQVAESQYIAGKTLRVTDVAEFDWNVVRLAFFVGNCSDYALHAERAASAGCLVIDGSGLFTHVPDVPLLVPGVNDGQLAEFRNRNIVSLAGSLTCQLLLALKPLMEIAPLAQVQVTSLLAASGAGKVAVEALARQSASLLNGQGAGDDEPFAAQLAFNVLPLLPDASGSVAEERRLVEEVRKILPQDNFPLFASFIQVPVFYGHGQMVSVTLQQPLYPEQGYQAWQNYSYITLSEITECPTPVTHAAESLQLSLGCVRESYAMPLSLQFWSVADNVRFTSALMAVQVAEKLAEEYLS